MNLVQHNVSENLVLNSLLHWIPERAAKVCRSDRNQVDLDRDDRFLPLSAIRREFSYTWRF